MPERLNLYRSFDETHFDALVPLSYGTCPNSSGTNAPKTPLRIRRSLIQSAEQGPILSVTMMCGRMALTRTPIRTTAWQNSPAVVD
jgi:hypothetical protein